MIINVETSARFDIDNLHSGRSWPTLIYERFTDKTLVDDEDYPSGDYSMEIFSNREFNGEPTMTLTEGDGLTVVDNSITVMRSATENTLKAREYHYRILCDVDADTSHQIIHGTLKLNK